MKFDFKKAFKAAQVPALALIFLTIFFSLFSAIPNILSLPLEFAILAYAGYFGVKDFELNIANGALAGAIAAFLSMALTAVANVVLIFTGVIPVSASISGTSMDAGTLLATIFAIYLIATVLSSAYGFIFGAIGAYIAKKK